MVFSEPTEVYNHGYTYQFDAVQGRVMVTDEGQQLPLFMSTDKLGWLRWQPVTDPELVSKAIRHRNERICAMSGAPPTIFAMPALCGECDDDAVASDSDRIMPLGDGKPTAAGMASLDGKNKHTLKGVALLRREHVVCGHC